MSDYNGARPNTNGISNHTINTNYNRVFESPYGFSPPQHRELNQQEIGFHKKRISILPDRPLGRVWRSSVGLCNGLGLNLSGNQMLIADTIITESILAYVQATCVGISLNRNTYSGKRILNLYDIKVIIRALNKLGLIHFYKMPQGSTASGVCSFLRARKALIDEFAHRVLFGFELSCELDGGGLCWRNKVKRTFHIPRTRLAIAMRKELRQQNEFMQTARLTISNQQYIFEQTALANLSQRRIFSHRGGLPFHQSGGRMYGTGYQNCPKEAREFILIDGLATGEEDFPEFHPSLLRQLDYSISEPPYEGHETYGFDIDDPEWCDLCPTWIDRRKFYKMAVNTLLNAKDIQQATGAIAKHIQTQLPTINKDKAFKLAIRIREQAEMNNPDLRKYFGTDVGVRLQSIDGEISALVQKMGRKQGIHILNLHDGFRVQEKYITWLKNTMEQARDRVIYRRGGAWI